VTELPAEIDHGRLTALIDAAQVRLQHRAAALRYETRDMLQRSVAIRTVVTRRVARRRTDRRLHDELVERSAMSRVRRAGAST
jgi:hypothetical protein